LWLLIKDGYDMSGVASDTWKLPTEDFVPGDNIRHTAERALNAAVSRSLDVFFELDSPASHLPLSDGTQPSPTFPSLPSLAFTHPLRANFYEES
jgi:hypothetical protein